jgi:hypothetical protein
MGVAQRRTLACFKYQASERLNHAVLRFSRGVADTSLVMWQVGLGTMYHETIS